MQIKPQQRSTFHSTKSTRDIVIEKTVMNGQATRFRVENQIY